MAAPPASTFALARSARARTSATWACHLPRSSFQWDAVLSLAPFALSFKRSVSASACSRALATSALSWSLVRSLAALSWSAAAFALSEIFSNCVLRSPSAIKAPMCVKAGAPPTLNRRSRRATRHCSAGHRRRPKISRGDNGHRRCAAEQRDVLRADLRSITMAAPDIDAQVMEIGSVVGRRLDEMAKQVASSVRANVEFYKDTGVVSADELLSSSTENIRFLFNGLRDGASFDTSPAVATRT